MEKSPFLDLLLNDIHLDLLKSRKSDFSNLFLNGIKSSYPASLYVKFQNLNKTSKS